MEHWIFVFKDIVSVVKFIIPAIGCAMMSTDAEGIVISGGLIYLISVLYLGGVL